jgi:hypothetical protein
VIVICLIFSGSVLFIYQFIQISITGNSYQDSFIIIIFLITIIISLLK